jgi:hypothetical protein
MRRAVYAESQQFYFCPINAGFGLIFASFYTATAKVKIAEVNCF